MAHGLWLAWDLETRYWSEHTQSLVSVSLCHYFILFSVHISTLPLAFPWQNIPFDWVKMRKIFCYLRLGRSSILWSRLTLDGAICEMIVVPTFMGSLPHCLHGEVDLPVRCLGIWIFRLMVEALHKPLKVVLAEALQAGKGNISEIMCLSLWKRMVGFFKMERIHVASLVLSRRLISPRNDAILGGSLLLTS